MRNGNGTRAGWQQRILHEAVEYVTYVVYLAIFFGSFTTYRRLLLAEYHISYLSYGVSLVEALVLAKVIMVGDALRLGRGLEDKPLVVAAAYKTLVFTPWVAAFGFLERTVEGVAHGKGLTGGFHELVSMGKYELLARVFVTCFAFIPFFAVKELGRVLGKGELYELFFRRRGAGSGPDRG